MPAFGISRLAALQAQPSRMVRFSSGTGTSANRGRRLRLRKPTLGAGGRIREFLAIEGKLTV